MRKRKKKPETTSPEEWERLREQHERTQRLLAERIAYHEARIAARESTEGGQTSAA